MQRKYSDHNKKIDLSRKNTVMNVIKLSLCVEPDFLIFKRKNEGSQHRRMRHVTSITLWDFLFWLRCSLDWIHRFLLHNGVKMLILLFAFIHDDVRLHLHKVFIVLVLILGNVIIIIVTVPVWLITNWLKFILSINTRVAFCVTFYDLLFRPVDRRAWRAPCPGPRPPAWCWLLPISSIPKSASFPGRSWNKHFTFQKI